MGTHIVSGLESKLPERTTPTVEQYRKGLVYYSNITSFFRFVDKRGYRGQYMFFVNNNPLHRTVIFVFNTHAYYQFLFCIFNMQFLLVLVTHA
jgi:hypothetical protein